MGYFKRKLNRRRAGAEAAGHERELVEHGAWERLETGTELPGPARFLRFRIAVPNPDTPHLLGIFSGISEAEDLPDVPEAITDWIERESEWFANHLPYPYLDREDCVFFFKSDAASSERRCTPPASWRCGRSPSAATGSAGGTRSMRGPTRSTGRGRTSSACWSGPAR